MKKLLFSSIIFFVCIFFTGCLFSNENIGLTPNDFPVSVSDVKINKKPEKVVVLSDSIADVIISLGYETQLIAKTEKCSQEEISSLDNVDINSEIDIEKLKSISPDLILDDSMLNDEQKKELSENKITVIDFPLANNRSELELLYINIGKILAGEKTGYDKGKKTVNNMLLTLDDINRIVPHSDVPVTSCYIYKDGSFATGNMISGELIELSGALNIGDGDSDGKIDFRTLELSNPDYIFYSSEFDINILKDELSNLNAVKNNNLYSMDDFMMIRQGESMVEAVSFMAKTIFPQISSSKNDKIDTEVSNKVVTNNKVINTDVSVDDKKESSKNKDNLNLKILVLGNNNDDVLKLEKRLDDLNYMPIKPDGMFNQKTVRAITDFQFINKLPATGELNERTLDLLFSNNAIKRQDPAREK